VRFLRAPVALGLFASSIGCGGAPPPVATAAPVTSAAPVATASATATPSSPNGRVRIRRDDATADEPSYLTLELWLDGAFTAERVVSNGDRTSTVTACVGRIPAAEATAWHTRIRNEATLMTAPRTPSFAEAIAQHIEHRYEVLYASKAGNTYAAPAALAHDVDVLIEHMDKAASCKAPRRAG
jgi:hypothetical protein